MRRLFVAGNWKMNTAADTAADLSQAIADAVAPDTAVDVLVAPPFPYLSAVANHLRGSGVKLGAQNAWKDAPGAYTGEVAASMLTDVGCSHVILGHSERRDILGESDSLINEKVACCLDAGLGVILCVGEHLEDREADRTEDVLNTQMTGSLEGILADAFDRMVIAYEPVWAIGTGRTASPDQAESVHKYLRKWLADHYNPEIAEGTQILYGGSVKANNAAELLSQPNVDGALVGGASLDDNQFKEIIKAAEQQTDG